MKFTGNTEQLGKLYEALSKAQGDFSVVEKGADNPFFKSKYADLSSILKMAVPILSKHGLCVMAPVKTHRDADGHGSAEVTVIIAHPSGARVEASCSSGRLQGNNVLQAIGTAHTYLRRYQIQGMLNISCDVDDDGNSAGPAPQSRRVK